MKRIGVLSDTHGLWDDRYAQHFAACDEIWHAGDVGSAEIVDRLEAMGKEARVVWGNADDQAMRLRCPKDQRFVVEEVAVWLTHIGGYPGRYAPGIGQALRMWRMQDRQTHLFVCGHSHILKVMFDRNCQTLYLNPGAAGWYGQQVQRTLMRFVIDGSEVRDLEVIELA